MERMLKIWVIMFPLDVSPLTLILSPPGRGILGNYGLDVLFFMKVMPE